MPKIERIDFEAITAIAGSVGPGGETGSISGITGDD